MFRKALVATLPVLLAVLTLGAQTAYAAGTWQATFEGTGSDTPGYSTTSSSHTGTIGGTLIGYATLAQGTSVNAAVIFLSSCNFTYQSPSGTVALDRGTEQGVCGGGTTVLGTITIDCSATASLSYTRVGSEMVISGTCIMVINGRAVSGSLVGYFHWQPTSPSTTVTTFAISGEVYFVTTQ